VLTSYTLFNTIVVLFSYTLIWLRWIQSAPCLTPF
jgi:hypothetical protein